MDFDVKKIIVDGLIWVLKDYECSHCGGEGKQVGILLSDDGYLEVANFPNRNDAISFINSAKKAGIKSEGGGV
ncbi:MAG: hypothetical protein GY928_20600 [Colwellia sp.]|nr:hypothetical protein [Colwellia sp.]